LRTLQFRPDFHSQLFQLSRICHAYALGGQIALISDDTISGKIAKDVFAREPALGHQETS